MFVLNVLKNVEENYWLVSNDAASENRRYEKLLKSNLLLYRIWSKRVYAFTAGNLVKTCLCNFFYRSAGMCECLVTRVSGVYIRMDIIEKQFNGLFVHSRLL